MLYDPLEAFARATEHANHYVELIERLAPGVRALRGMLPASLWAQPDAVQLAADPVAGLQHDDLISVLVQARVKEPDGEHGARRHEAEEPGATPAVRKPHRRTVDCREWQGTTEGPAR